jgi:hypothetical protein
MREVFSHKSLVLSFSRMIALRRRRWQ